MVYVLGQDGVENVKDGFIQVAVDAPEGVYCTKAYFKVENVSLG